MGPRNLDITDIVDMILNMTNTNMRRDVAIVGGGLAGLAAGYALTSQGYSVVVLEQSDRIGGRARTTDVDGLAIDLGAQFIADFYRTTLQLVDSLGVRNRLTTRPQRAYVLRESCTEPIWPADALLKGRALSLWTKLRLPIVIFTLIWYWGDLDISDLMKSKRLDNRSASEYVTRAMGKEALEYFFAPLLRGLLYWDADTTSEAVVLSTLKAAMKYRKTYRMQGGIAQLAVALANGQDAMTGVQVEVIKRSSSGGFEVSGTSSAGAVRVQAKAVICATPASSAAELVQDLPSSATTFLKAVSYSRTVILTYRVPVDARDYPLGAILFSVSSVRDLSSINPCYASTNEADADSSKPPRLLNVFLSDFGYERYHSLDDSVIAQTVLARIREVMGDLDWLDDAKLVNVWRWQEALPRFGVGYIRQLSAFENLQRDLAGIAFAGDYLGGPFIEGALISGQRAASLVGDFIRKTGSE